MTFDVLKKLITIKRLHKSRAKSLAKIFSLTDFYIKKSDVKARLNQ